MRITPEDRETIKKVCPKFSRICACMVNNPEYGLTLTPKAKRALNTAKSATKSNASTSVVSARVKDREKEILSELAREQGVTVGELIKSIIEEKIHETAVCEGVSDEDIDLPD